MLSLHPYALAALLSLFTKAHAHATFQEFWVGGVDQAGKCVRTPLSNSPVTSVSTNDLACNVGTSAAASSCTVAAGTKVTVEMHQQPGDRSCSSEAIGGNHDGPTIIYLAKVDNAATAVGSSANWFKIGQTGLVSADYWGTDVMNANCGKVDVTIPADIAPGDYLLRAEVIALHVAGSVGGAQFYMSCFQLTVTGGGSATPPTVKLPGAYSATDPGILFNLYGSYTSYTVPGPPVYVGGGGSTPPPSSTSKPGISSSPATSSTTSKTSSAPPVTTSTRTGTVPQYGQCGGIGYTGDTGCVSPFTCVKSNDYYSQCL